MNLLPLTDEEITELMRQEPVNDISNLPSDEQPTNNQPTYIYLQ